MSNRQTSPSPPTVQHSLSCHTVSLLEGKTKNVFGLRGGDGSAEFGLLLCREGGRRCLELCTMLVGQFFHQWNHGALGFWERRWETSLRLGAGGLIIEDEISATELNREELRADGSSESQHFFFSNVHRWLRSQMNEAHLYQRPCGQQRDWKQQQWAWLTSPPKQEKKSNRAFWELWNLNTNFVLCCRY